MMPAGTSTNATREEIRKALVFLYPMEKRGKETELSSGKFWTPITTDTITACKNAGFALPFTGGTGFTIYILFAALMLGMGVYFCKKSTMKKEN